MEKLKLENLTMLELEDMIESLRFEYNDSIELVEDLEDIFDEEMFEDHLSSKCGDINILGYTYSAMDILDKFRDKEEAYKEYLDYIIVEADDLIEITSSDKLVAYLHCSDPFYTNLKGIMDFIEHKDNPAPTIEEQLLLLVNENKELRKELDDLKLKISSIISN